jgi:flagellar L-ring protein precursor FlgH
MLNSNLLLIIVASFGLLLSGCATSPPELSEFEPLVRPVPPPTPNYDSGSLYQVRSISLFEDPKPYRIGDVLTIILQEQTSASKTAATSTLKDDDIDINVPSLLGVAPTHNGNTLLDAQLTPSREFSGEADSSQSNSLTGEITVTVVDILPNGNLVVQGEKWLTLNKGKEYIRIAGVIRPQDVKSDNTITSSKLADAQIAYSGEGFLADSNEQGWLSKFFSSKWWPF